MKELLSKSFLFSGLASLAFHFFSAVPAALEFAGICNKTPSQMFADKLRNSHWRAWHRPQPGLSPWPPFPHLTLRSDSHLSCPLPTGGRLPAFSLPRMSQIMDLSELAKEVTLAWNQKPELIWSFIHSTTIFKHFGHLILRWERVWCVHGTERGPVWQGRSRTSEVSRKGLARGGPSSHGEEFGF